jgi:hypothetical protein
MRMAGYGSFGNTMLPPELEERVNGELEPGERLVWSGQPRAGWAVAASCLIWLFALPWTAFALFWTGAAAGLLDGWMGGANAPQPFQWFRLLFALWGVPFILVGLGMFSTPYWVWRRGKRTCYALTDRRAIVWQPGLWRSVHVRSYRPEQLKQMSRVERSDGSGDLIFEQRHGRDSDGDRTTTSYGFLGIERVREVEDLIEKNLLESPR